jgi:hypothetical protein
MTDEATQDAPVAESPAPTKSADPFARLKAAVDVMTHQGTLDIHDRLTAQANAIKAMADVLFSAAP